jgi:hypothetical protein
MGTGGSLTQPVMASQETKQQQRLLSKVAAAAQVRIPNGCKPWVASQFLTAVGVKDLDSILGGGLPLSSMHSVVCDTRTTHAEIYTRAYLWEGYLRKQRCVLVTAGRSDQHACSFAQQVLRPALVNQKNGGANGVQVGPSLPQNGQNGAKNVKNVKKMTIDDEEDELFSKPSKTKGNGKVLGSNRDEKVKGSGSGNDSGKITQGSVQDALNNDGVSNKLTIAWQYDKYQGKTMDDSNLSGVNDEVISDNENDDEKDDEIEFEMDKLLEKMLLENNDKHDKHDQNDQNDPLFNIYDNSQSQIDNFKEKYDFHIITPTSKTTPTSPQHHTFIEPRYHRSAILQQILSTINLPTAQIHLTSSKGTENDQIQQTPIVPNRILVELTPAIMDNYDQDDESLFFSSNLNNISQKFQYITPVQFLYSLYNIALSTNTVITLMYPAIVANDPLHYNLILTLSQLVISMSSFASQVSLSNQNILQSQIGSAAELFSDKHDGLLTFHKFPRKNTPFYSYRLPDATLFLYRRKKQLTATITSTETSTIPTLGIAKLVLPPEVSRSGDAHKDKVSGMVAKDLFDEAVIEITKKALHDAEKSNLKTAAKHGESGGEKNNDKDEENNACPTCGSKGEKNEAPQKNSFSGASKTAKEQQLLQQRQNDVIIEEEGDEDELE